MLKGFIYRNNFHRNL